MRIHLLGRVSTQRQEKEETIETQIGYLHDWSSLNQHQIVETYVDEAVSGTVPLEERPDGSRLVADLPLRTAEAIVVYKLDRLGRSAVVIHNALATITGHGFAFISAKEGLDTGTMMGRMMLGFIALFAEFEKESIKERSMDGRIRIAREGRWGSGPVRYGYRRDESGKLEPVMETAAVIGEMFRLVEEEALGAKRLVRLLNERGIPGPGGGRWHTATVSKMLIDPIYRGEASWAGIAIPCPPLVAPARWERVQQIIRDPERRRSMARRDESRYLLAGLIRCGSCGRLYGGQHWKNGRRLPPGQHGYICHGRHDAPAGQRCPSPWLPGADVEAEVLADCEAFYADPERLGRLLKQQEQSSATALAPLQHLMHRRQKERADLRDERQRLVIQLGKGRITEPEFDQHAERIEAEDTALARQVQDIAAQIALLRTRSEDLTERQAMLAEFRDQSWTAREKIRFLVRDITVMPDGEAKISYWPLKPGETINRAVMGFLPYVTYRFAA